MNAGHWIEKHGIELRRDDWLITVIRQQYANVLSVKLLHGHGSHFLAALRYALTNPIFIAL